MSNAEWTLLDSYFKSKSFADQEIASYNQFIEEKLTEIVEENKEIVPKIEEVRIELSDIEILKPRIIEVDGSPRTDFYPTEARLRNRTYAGPLYLTMKLYRRDVEQDVRRTYIGELPTMIKSKMCWLNGKSEEELIKMGEDPLDFGGYFIINGAEKVLMTQEVLSSDRVLINKNAKGDVTAEVISTRGAFKGRVRVTRKNNGLLSVSFPASPRKLRLFVLLKALGLESREKVGNAFTAGRPIENDILLNWEALDVENQEDALDRIGKYVAPGQVIDYRLRRAQEVIDGFLLPHIGQGKEDRLAKAYYLGMMASKAIERFHGLREEDDKDHYANKRLELSGKLMEHLFRYAFKYLVKDLKFQIDRTITRRRKLNISTIVRPDAITERIRFAMSTGNWIGRATGVSKYMDRVNYLSPLTDIRKVKSSLNKNRELYEARDVHGTHWGRMGAIETPDGPNCVAPETEIWLENNTQTTMEKFSENWHNEKIISIDWDLNKEEKNTNIARYLGIVPKQKVYKIKTKETNRELIATADHPMYAEKFGKIELEKLGIGNKIAVLPGKPLQYEKPTEKIILTEKEIIQACPEKSDLEHVLRVLNEKKLLPVIDNGKLPILARLTGHLFGDGTISIRMRKYKSEGVLVFTGNKKDLEEIAKDVQLLGFKPSKQTTATATSVLANGQIISGSTTRMSCYSKPLFVLFKALEVPTGDKALMEYRMPTWIKNGRKSIGREFLSAYFGSEMTKPSIDKRYGKTFLQPSFSLNKAKEKVTSGLEFVEDIKELLAGFEVSVSKIVIVDGVKRKSGIETRKIKVKLSGKLENLMNVYGTIGFTYCTQRKSLARAVYQYLLEKKCRLEKRVSLREHAIALYVQGLSRKQIVQELNHAVRVHEIGNWIRYNKIKANECDFPKFNEWLSQNLIAENGLCWETIESKEEVECKDVRDVTTVQDYHNFIANGFVTGNCGLVKNLALLARVTNDSKIQPVEEFMKYKGVKLE